MSYLDDLLKQHPTYTCVVCGATRVHLSTNPPRSKCQNGSLCQYSRLLKSEHMPSDSQTSLLKYVISSVRKLEKDGAHQDQVMQRVARLLRDTRAAANLLSNTGDRELVERSAANLSQLLLSKGYRLDDTLIRTGRATNLRPMPPRGGESEPQTWSEWLFV